jgi:hypothetical protein
MVYFLHGWGKKSNLAFYFNMKNPLFQGPAEWELILGNKK